MIIGILGAPSTGKTTIARSVAAAVAAKTKKKVEYTDEFATEFIGRFKDHLTGGGGGFPSPEDQYLIMQRQLRKEIDRKAEILITDSPFFLSWVYAQRSYNPANPKEVFFLSEIYSIVLENINRYDHIFLCPIGKIGVQKKSERLHTEDATLLDIDRQIRGFLQAHRLPYIELESSDLNERVKEILNVVKVD